MKEFKLGHIKELNLSDIKKALSKEEEFRDINKWKFKRLNLGEMHNTYIISNGKKKYFIKEVKNHEAPINYFLYKLRLKHLVHTNNPNLLDKKILVLPFLQGKILNKRKIDYRLLYDFIIFQNQMNNKKFFDKYNRFKIEKFNKKDEGLYNNKLSKDLKKGYNNLKLLKKYDSPLLEEYIKIIYFLNKNQEHIIKELSNMPLSYLHHDFKEINIIDYKREHKLIDWGSSNGYGPFLFDLSLFLVNDDNAFNIFMEKSDIARKYSKDQVRKWLYVALAYRFNDFINWTLRPNSPNTKSKERLNKILKYNYKTYNYLLKK